MALSVNPALIWFLGIVVLAAALGFLIEYTEASRRFPPSQAVLRSLRSGMTAAMFLGALAWVVIGVITH